MRCDPREALRKWFKLRRYSDQVAERVSGRHRLSLNLVESKPGLEILDVGSSYGWLESMGPQTTPATFRGVEFDPKLLAEGRRNVPSADIVEGSVLCLTFSDAQFDGAVMFEVLEHIPARTEVEALSEIHRVLKPAGWFILSTPFDELRAKLFDPAFYFGHRHYSRDSLVGIFTAAGFRVEHFFVRGGWWEIIGMLGLYAFKHLVHAEVPFKATIERLRDREFLRDERGFTTAFVIARSIPREP